MPTLHKDNKAALANAAADLEALQSKEEDYRRQLDFAILPIRVKMGLHCLKAHMIFAVQDASKRGAMKGKKSSSTVDELPQGFEGWLLTEAPFIKKGSAYGYMTALKGLSLDETATEEDVDAALATLMQRLEKDGLPAPSLKFLKDAATEGIAPPPPEPTAPAQLSFNFLKDELTKYREFSDGLLRIKSDLEKNPDFFKAAKSRAYHILQELTGTHWQPSDTADELADIDPDTISV